MNKDFKNFNTEMYPNSFDCKDRIVVPTLSHGSNIIEIITGDENINDCDAIFTTSDKFKLGIRTADCASVCIGDGQKIGIVHLGWRGLCSDLCENFLSLFNNSDMEVYVGPFLHSFQIQKDYCYDMIVKKFGYEFLNDSPDGIYFNFEGAIKSMLPKNAHFDERSTKDDLKLPSHRRNGTKDRLLTTISFK